MGRGSRGRRAGALTGALSPRLIDLDDPGARQELHDQTRRDDRADTELHARAAVRGHNHTRPIERIRATGGVDAIKRQLGAHEEHKESDNGVQRTLAEGYPAIGGPNLGENREKGAHEVQDTEAGAHR